MALISFRIFGIFSFLPFQLRSLMKQNINLHGKKEEARISMILFNWKLKAVSLRFAALPEFLGFSWVAALSKC